MNETIPINHIAGLAIGVVAFLAGLLWKDARDRDYFIGTSALVAAGTVVLLYEEGVIQTGSAMFILLAPLQAVLWIVGFVFAGRFVYRRCRQRGNDNRSR